MKRHYLLLSSLVVCLLWSCNAVALTIVAPTEGQSVTQLEQLEVIVKPDAGEDWAEVILDIFPMSYNSTTNDYRGYIEIPEDKLGNIVFTVGAYDNTGKKVQIKRNLLVKMPPNVTLRSISTSEDIMILYRAPQDMSSADKKTIEEDQLTVAGVYSDGYERHITSSSMGTTYSTSDESIVKVDSEGKVVPQALGTAEITVRNGKYTATVKVFVRPYNGKK